ncbi:MAG: hypothetical protein J6T68_02165 [Candidatus Methanomethylophilaceae archaeon]|nr:hypothetical protein [Candidatus Methanomethylophilaceae archaeon]
MKCLVIYSSVAGNTKAVAEYIANKTGGMAISIADAKPLDLEDFDTVIFGSRVHAGSIKKSIVEFAKANKERLSAMRTAFFCCCVYKDEKAEKQVAKFAQELGISTGTYFNKGKQLVQADPAEIDDFLSHVESK